MWRPENWYELVEKEVAKEAHRLAGETEYYHFIDGIEIGADAMLEALLYDGLLNLDLDNTPSSSMRELIMAWLYIFKGRGALVFIPDEDKPDG
jgi:hypothetical protein